ncbi:hypothetical protein [Lichenibacterium dinghuense]|uniref:hypothetical protein n=1 Tax=Lichenibacterium dinghuense TaxID=2895977 RepID=UPI001F45E7B5|nr:hypothetical protein [Lichenibacterium sp. 6Y81]
MRALLERSRSARALFVLLALGAVLGLARAAEAGGDLGLRRDTFWPEPQPALQSLDVPAAAPVHRHRHARRIWAASHARPLRIRLAPRPHRVHAVLAVRRARPRVAVARARPAAEPQVVFPAVIVLPKPPRPALVSIYQDRTLRDGDAVMMADGIHVFHGFGEWPHRPRDFVRLTFAAALDWHLRQTLDVLDRNPPTRWTSVDTTAG